MRDIMEVNDIAFPHLGIYLENLPGKTFSFFGFPIAYYGLILGAGFLLGLGLVLREAKRTGQNSDDYWDLFLCLMVFTLIGARVYYVIFAWDMYKGDPLSVFNFRRGGLAIYGGVIAGLITLYVFVKIKKKNFLQMADTAVFGLVLGQVVGRWGNFMNREAFGEYTDSLFAMRLPVAAVRKNEITAEIAAHIAEGVNYIQVHPTFLYESLWNLALLILMLFYRKHKKFEGEVLLLYMGGYGLGRFWIEGLRTDQLLLPGTGIAVSQVLAICLFFFSIGAELWVRYRKKKNSQGEERLQR